MIILPIDACTIGVFSGEVTYDGRPMLWKNRDVSDEDQEYAYFDDGTYSYVTNIYSNDTGRGWMGVNEVGFGIINSDTYNNGTHHHPGPDDGTVMKIALKNCQTVEDFEYYLMTTNDTGRKGCHNYGVIDAFGGAAIFEASNTSYVRFDAADEPHGYLLRTNYAFSGDTLGYCSGYDRYMMAEEIVSRQDFVDYRFIIDSLASNLQRPGLDPMPLPYENPSSPYPFGYIVTSNTINREMTSSTSVIIGKIFGEDSDQYPYMWAMFGQPYIALPIPLWPNSGAMRSSLDGTYGSSLCDAARYLKASIYDHYIDHYFNTINAAEIREFIKEERDQIFDAVDYKLVHSDTMDITDTLDIQEFQDSVITRIEMIYDAGVTLFVSEPVIRKPEMFSITSYPNPFNSRITIQLNPPMANISAYLYDVRGNRIEKICEAGNEVISSLHYRAKDIPSGIYFIKVNTPGIDELSEKIIYIK
ncbi:MAG: T9SS type A sorting domain-containing protein [Candidatus Zixiibacteriota bacterium]